MGGFWSFVPLVFEPLLLLLEPLLLDGLDAGLVVGDGFTTARRPSWFWASAVCEGAARPKTSTTAPAASHGDHEPIVPRRERLVLVFIAVSHPVFECMVSEPARAGLCIQPKLDKRRSLSPASRPRCSYANNLVKHGNAEA